MKLPDFRAQKVRDAKKVNTKLTVTKRPFLCEPSAVQLPCLINELEEDQTMHRITDAVIHVM